VAAQLKQERNAAVSDAEASRGRLENMRHELSKAHNEIHSLNRSFSSVESAKVSRSFLTFTGYTTSSRRRAIHRIFLSSLMQKQDCMMSSSDGRQNKMRRQIVCNN
jgi:hypothetical protein